jgi:branched-chain amino acid transport system substrate-binding protein
VSADHQNNPDTAKTDAAQMYDRQAVDAIFDVPTSSAALAVADVAKQHKKLYFNISAASDSLNGESCNKYTYHYAYDTNMLANGTGIAATQAGAKSWYIIYPNYVFGQQMRDGFSAAVKDAGGSVVATDDSPFPNAAEDYSSLLLKASTLTPKPDTLGVMQAGADLQNVVKQYNQFKLRDKGIKLAVGLMFITDINALGPDAMAGTQFTDAWYWNFDATNRAFADKFYAKTSTRPTFAHAANYSAAMNYLEAVQAAGTDNADNVTTALDGKKINDVFLRNGTIRAADHLVTHDAYLAEVKPSSEVSEPWDYEKIIKTIPADQAFAAPSAACHM